MLDIGFPDQQRSESMPSLNHSYICIEVIKQLLDNKNIQPLPELTLDIDNGLTPDISVFLKKQIKTRFFKETLLNLKKCRLLQLKLFPPIKTFKTFLKKQLV